MINEILVDSDLQKIDQFISNLKWHLETFSILNYE